MPQREKRIVEITIDAKQFRSAARNVNSNLDKIRKQAMGAANAVKGIAAAFVGLQGAESLLQNLREIERLDGLLAGAARSSEDFAQSMDFLRTTADRLGLEMRALGRGYANFLAAARGAGLSLQETEKTFTGLATASAAFGLSTADLEGVLLGARQILDSTNVSLEDLRQVTDRIPGGLEAAKTALEQMGLGAELADKGLKGVISTGNVAVDQFLPRFSQALQDTNLEAATSNADSFNASLARMNNALDEIYRALVDAGLLDALAELVDYLAQTATFWANVSSGNGLFAQAQQQGLVSSIVPELDKLNAKIQEQLLLVAEWEATWLTSPENEDYIKGLRIAQEELSLLIDQRTLMLEQFKTSRQVVPDIPTEGGVLPPLVGPGTAAADQAAMDARNKAMSEEQQLVQQLKGSIQGLREEMDPAVAVRERYTEVMLTLNEALRRGLILEGEYTQLVAQAREQLTQGLAELEGQAERTSSAADRFGSIFSRAFVDIAVNGRSAADVLRNLERQVISLITQILVLQPLQKAVSGFASGEGLFAQFVGAILGSGGGAMQMGGPVSPGVPYLVGEAGPEVIVPSSAGTVIPNHELGDSAPAIHVHFHGPVTGEGLQTSAQQLATQVFRSTQRAGRRNG